MNNFLLSTALLSAVFLGAVGTVSAEHHEKAKTCECEGCSNKDKHACTDGTCTCDKCDCHNHDKKK